MATKNPFEQIRAKAGDTQKSVSWYQQQIKQLGSLKPNRLMANSPELVNTILPGRMYMFFYDAKLKDKLPYFDAFPLVLPFKKVPGGFYGINLHYLPYAARYKLLGMLSDFASDDKMDENTRLILSWKLLNSSSRLAMIKPCVKHYLANQLQSRFLQIKYPDWVTASQLPVERFQGAMRNEVWRDSREKY